MNIIDINPMAEALIGRTKDLCIQRKATEFIAILKSCAYGPYTLLEINTGKGYPIRIGSCVHINQNQLPYPHGKVTKSLWYICPASILELASSPNSFYQLESIDESKCSSMTISSYGIILKGRFSRNLMLSSDLNASPLGLPIFHFIHLEDTLPFCRSIRWVREKRFNKFRTRWTSQPITNAQAYTWVEFSCTSSTSCDEFTFIVRPIASPRREDCPRAGDSLLASRKDQSLQGLIIEALSRVVPGITEVQDASHLLTLLRKSASEGLTNLWALRFSIAIFLKMKAKFSNLIPMYTQLLGSRMYQPEANCVDANSIAAQFFVPMLKFLTFILMKLFHLVPFPFLKRLLSSSLHATPSA